VIILDDDVSFHEIWEKKLKDTGKILHKFYSGNDLISKFSTIPSTTLLLSDYEMLDQGMNGIDTILKLNHSLNSVLVTARSEERQIQERCANISLKLLPKNMIPFLVLEEIEPEIILIDDDKLIHYEWKNYFSKTIKFQSFYSIEDFIKHSKSISPSAHIYLDSDLGKGIVGEVDGIVLFNLGFRNLYLSTGFQKDEINKPDWIIDIYPKNPKKIFGDSITVI
jgi:CheY-like chemotaxis protein